ncbi:hypothetical protein EDD16DRAFT_1710173 [Pisolithus croceorrhizus]|nr:hypothetical protein EDD16DRAFT_1710173 [Pisolithus croceorrhizus]KAI6122572.1 hypothetical protein EV401DRAFT_2166385 [Pisolithus croceorrhizus]
MEQVPILSVNPILGPIIIGTVLSGVLYGSAIVQVYLYYQRFPADDWKIKSLVAFEISIQTIHLAFLTVFPTPTVIAIILCSPIAVAVQGYFVLRVYRLSEQPLLLIIGGVLVISKCALHLVFSIAAYIVRDAAPLVRNWGWSITGFLVLSIACDTLIATALSHHLRLRKTGFNRTSRIIDLIIVYTLATGLINSTTELAEAICFWTMDDNYVWLGLYVVESGLYTNSLLAALNSRTLLNRLWNCEVPLEFGLSPKGSETARPNYWDQKSPQPMLITITHETVSSQADGAPFSPVPDR